MGTLTRVIRAGLLLALGLGWAALAHSQRVAFQAQGRVYSVVPGPGWVAHPHLPGLSLVRSDNPKCTISLGPFNDLAVLRQRSDTQFAQAVLAELNQGRQFQVQSHQSWTGSGLTGVRVLIKTDTDSMLAVFAHDPKQPDFGLALSLKAPSALFGPLQGPFADMLKTLRRSR